MAYIPRSSFIPKQATGAVSSQVARKHTVNVFGLIATILLLVATVGSVGVFFYNTYLEKQLADAKAELGQKSTNDAAEKIREIKVYDFKLNVAHNLLNNHLAVSDLFEELQDSTKETVQFSSFSYEYEPGFDVNVSLTADTEELASVVLQEMQFNEDGLFSNFLVTDIGILNSIDETGEGGVSVAPVPEKSVGFTVQGTFKKDLLKYSGENTVSTSTARVVTTPPPTVQSGTSTTQTSSSTVSTAGTGSNDTQITL